eukprot:TRINITY_DN17481_c0_g1_i2.p1 TRINITY_DN17481_c0_g1~~TRINITY_DN17481_c0_g1_i2.p1  ORF type:complete len:510 (-),score=66.62 TRINITY_DN17481_c0_g1_i2:212-1741(-)
MARQDQGNFGYSNHRGFNARGGRYYEDSVAIPQPRPQGAENGWESESEEEVECPLCLEPMDETDQTFYPCPCGYQICLYCFNRVKEKNDKCPACRAKFNSEEYRYVAPDEAPVRHREPTGQPSQQEQQAQRSQLQAMADARARAMEAQARRCGACQSEGPPLEPDPTYNGPAVGLAAPVEKETSKNSNHSNSNSWASLAAGAPGANQAEGAWGNTSQPRPGDPWGQDSWPSLEPDEHSNAIGDEWDALAQDMARATITPEDAMQERAARAQQLVRTQQQAESAELDSIIGSLEAEISSVNAQLESTREVLTREEGLYDHYQGKAAELRVQQQNWDAGVIDLLSRWQGWTDRAEQSEANHFEKESVLMAQLITHQQDMAAAMAQAAEPPVVQNQPKNAWGQARGGGSESFRVASLRNEGLGDSDPIWQSHQPASVSRMASQWDAAAVGPVGGDSGWATAGSKGNCEWGGLQGIREQQASAEQAWGSSNQSAEPRAHVMQASVWGGGNGLW